MNDNVAISNITVVDETTGHAIIQVSREGENSIFIHEGSNGIDMCYVYYIHRDKLWLDVIEKITK